MRQKRVCITLSEHYGKKLDEIAKELNLNRTAALRLLIASWRADQVEDLKPQINRLTNLAIILTSLVSGLIKDLKGNEAFYRLKNDADKSLKAFKESGKFTM